MHRSHVEFDVGAKVLLSMCNLKLHGLHKFRDRFVGPFVITERIGATAYRLDLSSCAALRAALRGVHNVSHMSLLCNWHNNGVHADVPPIEIDG